MNTNTGNAEAWLIQINSRQQCAVGIHELQEVIQAPDLKQIPLTPVYCQHILFWRKQLVPVVHLANLLFAEVSNETAQQTRIVGIFAYQTQAGHALSYGALFLHERPKRTTVNDTQACALPEENTKDWEPYTISCFEHQGKVTPILGLKALYSRDPATPVLTHPSLTQ